MLVSKAQNGDKQALNDLFNASYNDIYYFALKTLRGEDLACDITQYTFIEIIKHINNLKEPAAFSSRSKKIAKKTEPTKQAVAQNAMAFVICLFELKSFYVLCPF